MQSVGKALGDWMVSADESEHTFTTKSGEVLPISSGLARWFAEIDEQRMVDRIRFCYENNLDPGTWTGCHACRGTGYHWETGFTCFCDYGSRVQKRLDETTEREFRERIKSIDFSKHGSD
jgi:hypothetical protein